MNPNNYLIDNVTLNVINLEQLSHFYQTVLGLTVLTSDADRVALGQADSKTPLLNLLKTEVAPARTSGLYHVAYLLPTRQALGEFLHHVLKIQYPLQGASDHGYSEAIYLADPEGNGIEVYWDKPTSEWEYRENGIIVGVTEPMDAEGVLDAARQEFNGLEAGSIIGHVHLAVSEIPTTDDFFMNLLGFTLTTRFGVHASFYGKDGYHHQFAGNIWGTRNLPPHRLDAPGLKELEIAVAPAVFAATLANLTAANYAFEQEGNRLSFEAPNGIRFIYQQHA